jgi:hypothetical protein
MIYADMAKKPSSPSVPATTRPRGRPPKPGGPIPHIEAQRAYRARLAAAGKVVVAVDASLIGPGGYRDTLEKLHNATVKLELRDETIKRLEKRNAYLEGELKLQEQHITNALKDNILLKDQLAKKKPIAAR